MYKPTYKKRTARMISWVCGSLFTLFSLLYLFVMQADLLATAQHLLSKGQTVYSPLWGTVIITLLLLLLQGVFRRIMVYPLRFHALYYFPSCVVLGLLTVHCSSNRVECTIVHQLDMAHGLYFFVYPCDMDGSAFPGS